MLEEGEELALRGFVPSHSLTFTDTVRSTRKAVYSMDWKILRVPQRGRLREGGEGIKARRLIP